MRSLRLQPSDAHWNHEPKVQVPWSAGVLAGVLQLEKLAGQDAGAPTFMCGVRDARVRATQAGQPNSSNEKFRGFGSLVSCGRVGGAVCA